MKPISERVEVEEKDKTGMFTAAGYRRWWHDPKHPVWTVVLLSVVLVWALFLSWVNASNFDHTEHKLLLQLVGASVASGGVVHMISKHLGGGK